MKKKEKKLTLLGDLLGVIGGLAIFATPFWFMLINSLKDRRAANKLNMALPEVFHWENYLEVIKTNDYMLITGFKNSAIITIVSVLLLIITCSMAGYVVQRRRSKTVATFSFLMMAGLMLPPAILPTIKLLQGLHVYKTLFGMILVEVALQSPFSIMMYRSFINSIPVELEEAAYLDGCSKWKIFSNVVFPLLKPVTSTIIILNAVNIFNDFMNALYFLPGAKNVTVQMSLYNFHGQFATSYNLLFADVILLTIPMLILFLVFNQKIVDGMVAGSVKG